MTQLPETLPVFQDLGISLVLGLLVGLQRQHVDAPLGGVRTFPLITVFGTFCGLLAGSYGGWVVAVGMAGVTLIVVAEKFTARPDGSRPDADAHAGLTTAAALLLMFAVGAYVPCGDWSIAVAVGGMVAILLQLKLKLHGFVARLSDADFKAIMQFVLISFVILPILPNQTFGWYDILNPREIWLMVVLVVGISLGGYVVWKLFGQQAGILLGGILGGTISSTATAVSFAKRTQRVSAAAGAAAAVVMISTTVSFIRVLAEITLVGQHFVWDALVPVGTLIVVAIALSTAMWFSARHSPEKMPQQDNPTELKSALVFGALYALILFAVAATKEHFPESGLFVVAVLSGLTDMDAITLSTSRLVATERLNPDTGWRIIVAAIMSNLVFKGGLVAALGHRRLTFRCTALFGVLIVVGGVLLLFW